MSDLHEWHREATKGHAVTLTFPARPTQFGGTLPEETREVTLKSARAVVVQRALNQLSPKAWVRAQAAFDASDEGKALADKDSAVRREHCELWLFRQLYEADHPDLVAASELSLLTVLAHHATPEKVHAHNTRCYNHVRHGKPLCDEHAEASK